MQFEETDQASELDMADMLKLLHQEFKITMITMLKDLMDKVDSMQKQMGSISREMEILRKTKRNARKEQNKTFNKTLMGLLTDWMQLRKESLS